MEKKKERKKVSFNIKKLPETERPYEKLEQKGDRLKIPGKCSMESSGFLEAVHRGETFPKDMVLGKLYTSILRNGRKKVSLSKSLPI